MNNTSASFIELPNYEKWNETKDINMGIRPRLFNEVPKPPLDVLINFHDKAETLIHSNKLNNLHLTNREIKYLAWVVLPCEYGRYTGLISINKAQKQILALFIDKDRFDSVAIEILVKEWNMKPPMYLANFDRLTTVIEKMLSFKKSTRLKHCARFLVKTRNDNGDLNSWANSLIQKKSELNFNRFKHFTHYKTSYFNSTELEKVQTKIRANFWFCYFNKRLVKNCWVASDKKCKTGIFTELNVEMELVNQDKQSAAFIMHIGDYIFIDLTYGEHFYVYSIKEKLLPDLTRTIIDISELMSGQMNKYSFTNAGYWQYKTSLFLKSSTGYMPTRAEYLIKNLK
jgi:hypothetical protein